MLLNLPTFDPAGSSSNAALKISIFHYQFRVENAGYDAARLEHPPVNVQQAMA
jgi:hypothetical protein